MPAGAGKVAPETISHYAGADRGSTYKLRPTLVSGCILDAAKEAANQKGGTMVLRRVFGAVAIFVAAASVAGCVSKEELKGRITGRWGPSPAMDAQDVNSVVKAQWDVLDYIVDQSRLTIVNKQTGEVTLQADAWFHVAEWGFNVGRRDCEIYMDNLFRMSREKQRGDAILGGLGSATTAILTATSATPTAISVLASAFGLSITVNDAIFQSYLFTQAPGLVANKVQDLQDKYRAGVEKAYKDDRTTLDSPDKAYNAIQHYYSLCLPHSIEGTLLAAVSDTKAEMPKSDKTEATTKTKKKKVTRSGSVSAADAVNGRPYLTAK